MEQFGIHEPQPLLEYRLLQTWRAIDHNLGVVEELLPDNVAEGRLLMNKILDRHINLGRSQLLTQSLIDFA